MIDALGLEIAAIRKKGGGTQIELRGGERVGESEGSWLYMIYPRRGSEPAGRHPGACHLRPGGRFGVLVSFRDGVLVVALEKDFEPKIPVARLVANDSFLVERLKERLEKIRSG